MMLLTLTFAVLSFQSPQSPSLEAEFREKSGIRKFTLQEITPRGADSLATEVVLDGQTRHLRLVRHSLRSTKHFQILVEESPGILKPHEAPEVQTYRGTVEGIEGSLVTATKKGGEFHSLIHLPGTSPWAMEPASRWIPGESKHVVYQPSDAPAPPHSCMQVRTQQPLPPGGDSESQGGGNMQLAEIAFDADHEFFLANNGSVADTIADIELVMNDVDAIYQRDTGIAYEITTIIVRADPADPYSTNDPQGILDEFTGEWRRNQGGVQRDVAHLMTGKNLNGNVIGIAWIGTICNGQYGYGVSSDWTNYLPWRVGLTAHELGHNWSANHCNNEDTCNIMCSSLGGCSGNTSSFAPSSKDVIVNYRNSRGCLDDLLFTVYVDANNQSPPHDGSQLNPFKTVADAVTAVMVGGSIIIIGPNSYPETLTIQKNVTVTSQGGSVTVGN